MPARRRPASRSRAMRARTEPPGEPPAMYHAMTANNLARELAAVTSASDARAVINRAARVAGVPADRPLHVDELLRICEAVAAEGGLVQEIAELIASRSLASRATTCPRPRSRRGPSTRLGTPLTRDGHAPEPGSQPRTRSLERAQCPKSSSATRPPPACGRDAAPDGAPAARPRGGRRGETLKPPRMTAGPRGRRAARSGWEAARQRRRAHAPSARTTESTFEEGRPLESAAEAGRRAAGRPTQSTRAFAAYERARGVTASRGLRGRAAPSAARLTGRA